MDKLQDERKEEVADIAEEGEVIAESRRKFVQAAAKIAVYTPPAMMLLMKPDVAAFAQSAGGGHGGGHGRGNGGGQDRRRNKRKKRRDHG